MLRHIIATSLAAIFAIESASAQSLYELVRKIENPKGPIDGSRDEFGISLTQVADYLVVGAYREDTGAVNAGAAYVLDREGVLLTTINNPTPEVDDWFGFEVRAVEDKIVIAAKNDSTAGDASGSVYLFNTSGELLTTIVNPTPEPKDEFGERVLGIDGKILVSALGDDTVSVNSGAVYLFDQQGELLQEFYNPNPEPRARFGRTLAAVGNDKVLVSAYLEDVGGLPNSGAAYLFDLDGNLLQEFPNPAPKEADSFSIGLAALGEEKVVFAALEDSPNERGGVAYIYDLDGNLEQTMVNPSPGIQDWFGRTMTSVGEERVLIGAVFDDTLGDNTGAAYLYDSSGNLLQTFLPPTPSPGGHFGSEFATMDDRILIGSHFDGGRFTGPGAVYMYAPVAPFPGDINGDLAVDQGDLDLVLLYWGDDATTAPDGWTTDLPSGVVDQDELCKVLLNWGATEENLASVGGIPEPSTYCLMMVAVVALARWRQGDCFRL